MCAHYSWSWDYLHWGVRWPIMQRVLIDAPAYKSPKKDDSGTDSGNGKHDLNMRLTPENGSAIANFINGLAEL